MTPFLSPNNRTLYFASNGHEVLGSRDIFVSHRLEDNWQKWTKPKNIGGIVNSEGMELSFQFIDKNIGLYTTTQNSDGYGDIRFKNFNENEMLTLMPDTLITDPEINIPLINLKEVTELKPDSKIVTIYGTVTNANDNKFLNAAIKINNDRDFNKTLQTDENSGEYSIQLFSNANYQLVIVADGYLSKHERLELINPETMMVEMNFILYPIEAGTTVNLDHVRFYQSTADLIETSYDQLDIVAQMMLDNPQIEIQLSGHTDNRGGFKLNLELSERRVIKVMDYLLSKGIDQNRISGKGYGSTRPIASNAGEETRKLNRRVEFTIIKD